MKNCIGLFGTCGESKWRDPFIDLFKSKGIDFFNPQVDDWDPSLAKIEAEHLASDSIILFPITSETYATGSLSEVGFSILNSIRLDNRRDFVVMIEQRLEEELMEDLERAKDSLRSRALVYEHLMSQNLSNIYLVETLEEMLEVSEILYSSNLLKSKISKFSIQNRK